LPKPKPTPKPKSKKSDIDDLLKEANKEAVAKPKAKPAPPTDQAPNAPDDPTSGALDGDEDVAKIKSKIESNWSQPASYRPSMQALLLVDLLPTGEVSNVQIKESSGDSGFDNSAEVAVRKSSPLPVPQDPQRFEKYFRKFNFLFCPDCRDNTY
jgi:colicin import membrane protein